MSAYNQDNPSISRTLDKLDNDPPVIVGLTGNELFLIAGSLQLTSLFTLFPVMGLITGSWIISFGIAMIVGILAIGYFAKKISKEKEVKPADIVWLDYQLAVMKKLGMKLHVFTNYETWSAERVSTKKR